MAKIHRGTYSRRGPDVITEELAIVLLGKESWEFKPLFTIVYVNLRARNATSGGEEMLRLRVYEKLQALVHKGLVNRVVTRGVKEYVGLDSLSTVLPSAVGPEALPVDGLPLVPITVAVPV